DLARVGALRLFDRVDHDARRWQSTGLFGQRSAKGFHSLVVHDHALAAILSQQSPHLDDIVFVTSALLGALLQHVGATRDPTGYWRTAQPWCAQARSQWRPWAHRPRWARCARTGQPAREPAGGCCELGLEFARAPATTATTAARASAAAGKGTTWSASPVAAK